MILDDHAVARLQAIGLTAAMRNHIEALASSAPGDAGAPFLRRITELQRDALTLHDGENEHPARALPALLAATSDGDGLAVGDWVFASCNRHGEWWVHRRVPPLAQLARRLHDGRDKVTRAVIVSNVDTALLVMGLDHDFNLRRLERYLALARLSQVAAVVLLTKVDLCDPVYAERRLHEVAALLPPGAEVLALNALGDEPRDALAPWLAAGQTLVLVGSSGAGKSTLTNALLGSHRQDTGASRSGDSRGRHTTPPAACTWCPAAPASSTRRACAPCGWTSTPTRWARSSTTSGGSRRNAGSGIAVIRTSPAAPFASRHRPNGCGTSRSCSARSCGTR